MKSLARMMRVLGVGLALSVVMAGSAHAAPVPFGWPVVADQQTTPAPGLTNRGALIMLNPIGSANAGVENIAAPDGYALTHPDENYFVDPTGVVQREDQIYDVADETATSAACGCNTGAIIEVNLVTGKQSLLATDPRFVDPTDVVIDPATGDMFVLDRGAGTGGFGAIWRVHEDTVGGITVTMVHDGGYMFPGDSPWRMKAPHGMDIDPQGRLVIADNDAGPGLYSSGTIFRIDPNAAPVDVNNPGSTPRETIAFNANGPADSPGSYFTDPYDVIVRPDGYYVADSKDNVSLSAGGIIRVDPTTGVQTFVAGGYVGQLHNFFNGAVRGVAPVDPTFGTPGGGTNDDMYVLDANYGADSTGAVSVINPTSLDPATNTLGFGYFGLDPFSFNATVGNQVLGYSEPRALVTSRNLPDPPVISVNTGAGDAGPGGAQIVEPAGCGTEGDAACNIKFHIRLDHTWKRTVTVNFVVTDQTATSGLDYVNPTPSGPLTATFVPGITDQIVNVPVKADTLDEPDETMKLTLSNPTNGTVDANPARSSAIGTIIDDDPPPTISATSPSDFIEFDGTVSCLLQLNAPSAKVITVAWASADGTAIQPGDYAAASGTATFGVGQTQVALPVLVKDDTLDEDAESFLMKPATATNATLPSGTQCTANIIDNDDPPKLTIKDIKSNEGNSGQRSVTLSVAMSTLSAKKVAVNWATADDAATTSDSDYVKASGTVTINPGASSASIVVKIIGDTTKEQDEPFKVSLSTPINASILSGSANVTIVNDDADAPDTPSSGTQGTTTGGGTKKACTSRRSFVIRVKKTKLHKAKVVSAKVYVNAKLVTTRKTQKRLKAPVVLKGLKKGTYRTVIKAKLSDGRTVTDIRVYHTCVSKSKSKKKK